MLVLVAAAVALQAGSSPDSTYSTAAVRMLVERASLQNRRAPDSLLAYQARAESELVIAARQADGVEQTLAVEQTESIVRWSRDGSYEQRVVGYRSQSVGITMSAAGLFRQAWTVPILYGNRIALLFGEPDSASGRPAGRATRTRRARRDSLVTTALHPFATDRERVYRFSGGDTVARLQPGAGREIPLVRVHVEPRPGRLPQPTVVFRGDIELDAERGHIVRMRGYFETLGRRGGRGRLISAQIEAVPYVELENGEFEQRYWLPTYQRVEAQAAVPILGEQRAVFRVVTRFRGVTVNPAGAVFAAVVDSLGASRPADSIRAMPHRITFAPADSIDAYRGWSRGIGELSAAAHSDDFADVAPDTWRSIGPPLVRVRYQATSDLFHYNRVEGTYTGVGAEAKLRDAAPGLVIRGTLGWAWAERTVRGRLLVERHAGAWRPYARVGRSLDITNDFREAFDSGSTLSALFSIDDYDYVDRHSAVAGIGYVMARQRRLRLSVEAGVASDRYAVARRTQGPLVRTDSGFRLNRGVDAGRYRVATLKLELHPDVSAAFVRPGLGALLQTDVAAGDLRWARTELRVVARRMLGPFIYALRADGGVVRGRDIPPQQLFELGENQNLPGYGYKEFAGNEAAVVRGLVMLPLPLWRTPLRVRRWIFPAVAPMVSAGVQSGWARASGDEARAAIVRLGTVADPVRGRPGAAEGAPVSRPTDGVKSSVDVRLRFFGGALSVGMARALDRHQSWRLVVGLAQVL